MVKKLLFVKIMPIVKYKLKYILKSTCYIDEIFYALFFKLK